MSLTWTKQPLTQSLARSLRAATRRHPSIDGHTFGFADLKEMWCAADVHVVLTHDHDRVWQYWYQAPVGGWKPISIHPTRDEAEAAAEGNVGEDTDPEAGIYVTARFPGGRHLMRVKVLSAHGERMLTEIFDRLGCQTGVERIEEAA